jgi:hypothetical protein
MNEQDKIPLNKDGAHCLDCGFRMVDGANVGLCPKCGSDRWHRTNPRAPLSLEALATQPPVGVCSKCGRKTWAKRPVHLPLEACGMALPNGTRCAGVFVPPYAACDSCANLRETLRAAAGVARFEDIAASDLIDFSKLLNQLERAEMVLSQLGWKRKAGTGAYHHVETESALKPGTELSDGHFVGCPPDCHIDHSADYACCRRCGRSSVPLFDGVCYEGGCYKGHVETESNARCRLCGRNDTQLFDGVCNGGCVA